MMEKDAARKMCKVREDGDAPDARGGGCKIIKQQFSCF